MRLVASLLATVIPQAVFGILFGCVAIIGGLRGRRHVDAIVERDLKRDRPPVNREGYRRYIASSTTFAAVFGAAFLILSVVQLFVGKCLFVFCRP